MSKQNLPRKRLAFSLIELSIVVLIISILIAGSLSVSKTGTNSSRSTITKARLDAVYKAFTNFLATNRRLPCPALLTLTKGISSYGNETATPGTCTNSYVSSTNAPNLVYGAIPTTALGLDQEMAEDGWGTKFVYVVDKRFTKTSVSTSSSDGFEITKGTPSELDIASVTDLSSMDIQNPLGTILLPNKNAIFLLLSHGANKFNGFSASSTAQNNTGVTDENNNSCNTCSTSGTTSYDRIFLSGSSDTGFDDIALFKTKAQLVRDAELEFIMCGASEAQTSSYSWTANGSYGCTVCSSTANNSKTCGKYGAWSALISSRCVINSSVCQ